MKVEKHSVVAIDYTLTDETGEKIDSSDGDAFHYLHGAANIIAGLERAIEGRSVGDQFQVSIQPSDGYGERDEELLQVVARENFEDVGELEVGMQFRVPEEDDDKFRVVTVVEIDEEAVTIDGNPELAGMVLNFDVTVRDIRAATQDEISHGHVHGPGGHEH